MQPLFLLLPKRPPAISYVTFQSRSVFVCVTAQKCFGHCWCYFSKSFSNYSCYFPKVLRPKVTQPSFVLVLKTPLAIIHVTFQSCSAFLRVYSQKVFGHCWVTSLSRTVIVFGSSQNFSSHYSCSFSKSPSLCSCYYSKVLLPLFMLLSKVVQ